MVLQEPPSTPYTANACGVSFSLLYFIHTLGKEIYWHRAVVHCWLVSCYVAYKIFCPRQKHNSKTQHKQKINQLASLHFKLVETQTQQLLVLNPQEKKNQIKEPNRTHETRHRSSQGTSIPWSSCVFLSAHTLLKWRNLSTRCNEDDNRCSISIVLSLYIITRPHALGQFTRTFLQTEMRGFLRTNLHHSRVGG